MSRRAVLLSLVLGVTCLVARGGDAPAGDAPVGDVPPTDAASEAAPSPHSTRWYQYVEELEITNGASTLRLAANVLMIVTMESDTVTVELRSGTGRKAGAEDHTPDKLTVLSGAADGTSWDLKPLVAEFKFAPWKNGNVRVEGLNESALREAATVLAQGPVANILDPDKTADYRIALASRGRPVVLEGQQRNGEHRVDWQVSRRGVLELGTSGWMIDMAFALPEQDAGRKGTSLSSEAKMVYCSAIPGPKDETVLTTTLTFPERGGLVYRRTCRLREIPAGDEGERPKRSRLARGTDLGGKAGAWSRTATLATLGVQRLAGVREVGLAMWVAQIGIDSLAGAEVPRVATAGAREGVSAVARLCPELGPPSVMVESDIGMRNLIRAEAGMSAVRMTAEADGLTANGTAGVPVLAIAMRRKVGSKWRVGPAFQSIWIDTNSGGPDETWLYAAGLGRAEFVSKSSSFGFTAGLAKLKYDMSSPTRRSSGDFWATAFGVEWEWWSGGKLGLGVKAQYAGGGGISFMLVQPSLRWRLGRNNVALQVHGTMVDVSDTEAVGGEIGASGTGGGAGILIRW